jgi:hypothetical protein
VPAFAVDPVLVVATARTELKPAASTTYVAWFVFDRHFAPSVWAEAIGSDEPFRVNPEGTTAFTGGIEGSTLVYERSMPGQKPDLAMVDLSTQTELDVPEGVNTEKSEFAPSISGTHVVFGREIPHGSSIVLFDTSMGTSQVLYSRTNRDRRFDFQAIQVNGNYVVWQKLLFSKQKDGQAIQLIGVDVFLHDVAAATTRRIPSAEGVWQYAPSVDAEGTMYFGRGALGCDENHQLIERQIDGTESVIYTFAHGRDTSNSVAVDNADGTTDVYFDRGSCRGPDFGDIVKLPGV